MIGLQSIKSRKMVLEKGDILSLIREHFPQIDERGLQEEIVEVGQLMHFSSGELILDFGSFIKFVPLVIEGSIKVVRQDDYNELLLYYLGVGQTCSMSFSCCMMNKKSIIKTIAEDDTKVLAIPIKHMDSWMRKYQSWKNFVMLSYDSRMSELVKTIDSIAFHNMDDRLWEYLQKKSEAAASKTLHTTHQEIAADLNASREAISRLVKQLEKMGKVKLGRNKIELV